MSDSFGGAFVNDLLFGRGRRPPDFRPKGTVIIWGHLIVFTLLIVLILAGCLPVR